MAPLSRCMGRRGAAVELYITLQPLPRPLVVSCALQDAGGQMYPIKNLTDSGMIPKPGFPDIIIYEATRQDVAREWAGVLSLVRHTCSRSFDLLL